MLIDEIVDFCDNEYSSYECTGCHKHHLCQQDCKNCLDDLHYHKNRIRTDYSCEHLLDYYVCRYSYKYCSEIIYALECVDLSRYPYFNILSLGCGGAPDLMAFDYFDLPKAIKYKGFDINESWEKIHNCIEEKSNAESVEFYRGYDVLDFFDRETIEKCNVIVVEYLISFFYSIIGQVGLVEWFDKLAQQVVSSKPSDSPMLIIINDADSIHIGRDNFPLLRNSIEAQGLTIINEYRRHFKENGYFPCSKRYLSNVNKFILPDRIKTLYKPAIKCESVQLILEVK